MTKVFKHDKYADVACKYKIMEDELYSKLWGKLADDLKSVTDENEKEKLKALMFKVKDNIKREFWLYDYRNKFLKYACISGICCNFAADLDLSI